MGIRTTCGFIMAMLPVIAAAQQFLPNQGPPVDPNIRFEVVAIKGFEAPDGQIFMRMAPGRFESSMPVGVLLRQALQKADYQIVNAPGWLETERYSIVAKPPDGAPPAAMSLMLQNLLKDRFQLKTRLETRELPIFNLVTARADSRLDPDLKPTSPECRAAVESQIVAARAPAAGRAGAPPPLPAMPGPNEPLPCGFQRIPPGLAQGTGRTIANLIATLSDLAGRPVIDKTGLTDFYDFTLKYAPEHRVAGPFGALLPLTPVVDPDAPNLFTAVQEQLGLKLETARGPVEVVVIEKIEKPTLD